MCVYIYINTYIYICMVWDVKTLLMDGRFEKLRFKVYSFSKHIFL